MQRSKTGGKVVDEKKTFLHRFSASLIMLITTVGFIYRELVTGHIILTDFFSLFSTNHTRIFTLGCSYSWRQDYSEHSLSAVSSLEALFVFHNGAVFFRFHSNCIGPINHVPMATLWPVHQFPSPFISQKMLLSSVDFFNNALNNQVTRKGEELSNWHIFTYHWIAHNQTFILSFWKCEKDILQDLSRNRLQYQSNLDLKNEKKKIWWFAQHYHMASKINVSIYITLHNDIHKWYRIIYNSYIFLHLSL